jgi:hypothetical protein
LNSVFAQYEELSSPQFAVINLSLRLLHTVLNLIKLLLNIFSGGWWTLFRTLKKSPYAELTWSETFVCNYSVTASSSFSTWIYIVHVIYIYFSLFFSFLLKLVLPVLGIFFTFSLHVLAFASPIALARISTRLQQHSNYLTFLRLFFLRHHCFLNALTTKYFYSSVCL